MEVNNIKVGPWHCKGVAEAGTRNSCIFSQRLPVRFLKRLGTYYISLQEGHAQVQALLLHDISIYNICAFTKQQFANEF